MKYFFAVAMVITLNKNLYSQPPFFLKKTYQFSINAGATWFLGDLGGNAGRGGLFTKDWKAGQAKPYVGFTAGYVFSPAASVHISFTGTNVGAADSSLPAGDKTGRRNRNLSFKSKISELTITGQYNLRFKNEKVFSRFSPFIFAGIGIFHFEPFGKLGNDWIALQPLRLEGQGFKEYPGRKPYHLTQLNIPFGAGVNYQLSEQVSLSANITWRKTFTDYIDDVSRQYIDPALFGNYLTPSRAALALKLHNRSGERNNGVPIYTTNDIRGKSQNDSWVTSGISVVFNINASDRVLPCPKW